ncbi:hypothetical protein NXY25_16650 [Bacteroides thetaiotaomicron]|nr:hypothetical protein [Bacteroides thetaiotaomicron]
MKNLTWQNPEQLFVAQELINKVKSKCCGIKVENKGTMDPKALNQWKFVPEKWTVPAAERDYKFLFGDSQ